MAKYTRRARLEGHAPRGESGATCYYIIRDLLLYLFIVIVFAEIQDLCAQSYCYRPRSTKLQIKSYVP